MTLEELAEAMEKVAHRLKRRPWSPTVEEAFDELAAELRRKANENQTIL